MHANRPPAPVQADDPNWTGANVGETMINKPCMMIRADLVKYAG
jgi:hypothetical protein